MKRARKEQQLPPEVSCTLLPTSLPGLRAAYQCGSPFPHIQLPSVFPAALLEGVRAELLQWEAQPSAAQAAWTPRRNDLYSFTQSPSLAHAPAGSLTGALAAHLFSPAFRALVEGITGVPPLADTMDISSALYRSGDYLLCHDDDLLTRRVAFILYLTPSAWAPSHGGELELFASSPATGLPTHTVTALHPTAGSLVLFEVTPLSFHHVAEVLEDSAGPRLSISGWFHGKAPVPREPAVAALALLPKPCFMPPFALPPGMQGGSGGPLCLASLVNPTYLRPGTAAAVAGKLQSMGGALLLPGFLKEEVYAGVMRALATAPWRHTGPPILQSLRTAFSSQEFEGAGRGGTLGLSHLVSGYARCPLRCLFAALCGEEFRALLQSYAGKGSVLGDVTGSVRAFAHGDYTIITDPEYLVQAKAKKAERAGLGGGEEGGGGGSSSSSSSSSGAASDTLPGSLFEATLMCVLTGADEWEDAWGGVTTYLTAEEEKESVSPQGNALCIVARRPGLLSFVKHVSRQAPEAVCQLHLQYKCKEGRK